MKTLRICSLLLLLCSHAVIAQSPARPGYQVQNPVPPPTEMRAAKVDTKKLKEDADALAQLAQSVPSDIDKTTNGVLPKDLPDKLKQIEKLAKRLRSELSAQLNIR